MKFYILSLLETLKVWYIAFLTAAIAFAGPVADLLLFVAMLMVLDFITGVWAAPYRGEPRESRKMLKSVQKMGICMLFMLMAKFFDSMTSHFNDGLLQIFLDKDNLETASKFKFFAAISFIIVIRECKSIDENWKYISGWNFSEYIVVGYNVLVNKFKLLQSKNKDTKNEENRN